MTPPNVSRHQQTILLDPDIAKAVNSLAEEKGISKQAVLREAVHMLLASEGKIPDAFSPPVQRMRNQLQWCDLLLTEALDEKAADMRRICAEVRVYVSGVLEDLGLPREKRVHNSGAKGRRQPIQGA